VLSFIKNGRNIVADAAAQDHDVGSSKSTMFPSQIGKQFKQFLQDFLRNRIAGRVGRPRFRLWTALVSPPASSSIAGEHPVSRESRPRLFADRGPRPELDASLAAATAKSVVVDADMPLPPAHRSSIVDRHQKEFPSNSRETLA